MLYKAWRRPRNKLNLTCSYSSTRLNFCAVFPSLLFFPRLIPHWMACLHLYFNTGKVLWRGSETDYWWMRVKTIYTGSHSKQVRLERGPAHDEAYIFESFYLLVESSVIQQRYLFNLVFLLPILSEPDNWTCQCCDKWLSGSSKTVDILQWFRSGLFSEMPHRCMSSGK